MVDGVRIKEAPPANEMAATGCVSGESSTVYAAPSKDGSAAVAMPIGVPALHGTPIDHIKASTHAPSVPAIQFVCGRSRTSLARRSTAAAAIDDCAMVSLGGTCA